MTDWPQPQSMPSHITSTEVMLLVAGIVFTLGVIGFLLFTFLRHKD